MFAQLVVLRASGEKYNKIIDLLASFWFERLLRGKPKIQANFRAATRENAARNLRNSGRRQNAAQLAPAFICACFEPGTLMLQ